MQAPTLDRFVALAGAALLGTVTASTPLAQVQGPGLGNLSYDPSELFTDVSVLQSNNGHGMGAMVNGYLMLVDHGDTNINVGIEFWDVSDPRNVTLAYRHEDSDTRGLRDAHSVGLSASYGADIVALMDGPGLQFWDVTDPSNLVLRSKLTLPNIPPASYTGIWWIFWQAPYVYVGGTTAGVYISRVDDVDAPEFIRVVAPNALGGVISNYVFAIGNLMVVMRSKELGFATLDISDPEYPAFLSTIPGVQGYSHIVAAGKIFTSGGDGGPVEMQVHDLGADGSMTYVGSVGGNFSNGAYGSYQDGYFHTGMSNVYAKFDVANMSVVGTATTGIANRDEDFCQVLGNLAFVGDDHAVGSGLYVHDVLPDSRPPEVTWIHPPNGATNVALTARVGVSMSDSIDFESPSTATFQVRELGGSALPGKYSTQMGIVNFSPDDPFEPNTSYEVVVDELEDLVGNSSPVFYSTFSTGASAAPPSTPVTLTNLRAANEKPYTTGPMQVGELIYIDREYTWGAMPARFLGHTRLVTANDDKFRTGSAWVRFEVDVPVEVNVLFDDRATQLPNWLASWTSTGESTSAYDVYSRTFAPGLIALGGNANPPMAGAQSMYAAVVVPVAAPPTAGPPLVTPAPTGDEASFQAGSVSGAPPFTYSWSFGDGSAQTPPSTSPTATHTYTAPGRYPVILTVANAEGSSANASTQIVYDAPTATSPTHSSTIVHTGSYVVNVNPDNDSVTALDASTLEKLWETPVGRRPRTLAVSPAGELWVACEADAEIAVLNEADGAFLRTIPLPRASQPYGIAFRPDGGAAYVTLQAGVPTLRRREPASVSTNQRVLAHAGEEIALRLLELDPSSGAITAALALDEKARGLAISHDSSRVFVSRFLSRHPAIAGRVWEVDTAGLVLADVHRLAYDPGPDDENSGRGVPNYLNSLTISPDGERLLIPSKKDNTARGLFRDGMPLTFESRTRTIVSAIDLVAGAEDLGARIDVNDSDMAQAIAFSPRGDLFAVALQGSNQVEIFDAEKRSNLATLPVGAAPRGLVFAPDGSRLFVHNFLGRSVTVYDTTGLVLARDYNPPRLGDVSTVASETLSATHLTGKRIFYDASDRRMNLDGYLSCASCHLDGGSDGQVWDFTQAGEGLRNTIPLTGRAGLAHGNVHWTANFDEIQDFENDIRFGFAGSGFLLDADFAATSNPLGAPKAGLDPDLDALAAFVSSLEEFPPSPYRRETGALTAEALLGRDLFMQAGCATCHVPPAFTDGLRHDVGTILPSSGQGIGQPLPGVGIETPTLRALWLSPPYLHNGAATTLGAVLDNAVHMGTTFTYTERLHLIAYLRQIE